MPSFALPLTLVALAASSHRQREVVAPFDVEPGKTYTFDVVAEGGG